MRITVKLNVDEGVLIVKDLLRLLDLVGVK